MKVQAGGDVVVDDDDGLESFLFIIFMTLYTTAAAAVAFPLLRVCLVERDCTHRVYDCFVLPFSCPENPRWR